METLVWYVSYGSNVLRPRFETYLTGGSVPGAVGDHRGARDPRPPRSDEATIVPHTRHFAERSTRWGGGMAFVRHDADGWCRGRRYLITIEQFADVVAQESRRPVVDLAIDDLAPGDVTILGSGRYDAVLALDRVEGIPQVTFTSPDPTTASPNQPTAAYLHAIASGLHAVHDVDLATIAAELVAELGTQSAITPQTIIDLVETNDAIGP